MVYPQLFLTEEEQQKALRLAEQGQAMTSSGGPQQSVSFSQPRGYRPAQSQSQSGTNETAMLQQQIQQLQQLQQLQSLQQQQQQQHQQQQHQQHQQQQQQQHQSANYFDMQRAEDILAAAGMGSNSGGMNQLQSPLLGGISQHQGLGGAFNNPMHQQMQQLQQLQQLQQQQQQQQQMQNAMTTVMNNMGASSNNMAGFNSAADFQRAMAMSTMNSQLLQSRITASGVASQSGFMGGNMNMNQAYFDPIVAKNQTGGFNELNQQPQVDQSMESLLATQQRLMRRRPSASSGSGSPPLQKRPFSGDAAMAFNLKMATDVMAFEDATLHEQLQQQQQHRKGVFTKKSQRRSKSFPVKLMATLLEHPNEDTVAWLPDGKSFVVVDPDAFVEAILKKAFKECKYSSFVRKLHRWGFVRLTSGTGTDCFHHPLFQRNRMEMVQRIVCTPRGESGIGKGEGKKHLQQDEDLPVGQPSLQGVEKFFRARDDHGVAIKSNKEEDNNDDEDDDDDEIQEQE